MGFKVGQFRHRLRDCLSRLKPKHFILVAELNAPSRLSMEHHGVPQDPRNLVSALYVSAEISATGANKQNKIPDNFQHIVTILHMPTGSLP